MLDPASYGIEPDTERSSLKRRGLTKAARQSLIGSGQVDRFTFLKKYNAVQGDNPLVSGLLSDVEGDSSADSPPLMPNTELLDLDLVDLVRAKAFFQSEDGPGDGDEDDLDALNIERFVEAFSDLCGANMRHQLEYLFMKIDCNSDGTVEWDELLTYIMARGNSRVTPLADERVQNQLVRVDPPDAFASQIHRESATHIVFAPNCSSYVTAARDGTLRAWDDTGAHEATVQATAHPTMLVHDMIVLPRVHKLALATDDRNVSFFELLDHASTQRWSLYGRMSFAVAPTALCAWTYSHEGAAPTTCLAVGVENGAVHIYDARRLIVLVKGAVGEDVSNPLAQVRRTGARRGAGE